MAQLHSTQIITERIQTVQGEITVNLNLTITLTNDGSIKVETTKLQPKAEVPEIPDTRLILPEFEETTELLPDFGEEVGK